MNRAAADSGSQDLAYFTAKSTVDAFEEKRAAQAAKEAEVKVAEEAKQKARAEAAQAKADEAKSAQVSCKSCGPVYAGPMTRVRTVGRKERREESQS